MRLPNLEAAIIDLAKIEQYCLNADHLRGRHKARVFYAAVGLTVHDAKELQLALTQAAFSNDASFGTSDLYGTRYIIDFEMERGDKRAIVRSCWIVRNNDSAPHFVTCFVR